MFWLATQYKSHLIGENIFNEKLTTHPKRIFIHNFGDDFILLIKSKNHTKNSKSPQKREANSKLAKLEKKEDQQQMRMCMWSNKRALA